MRALRDGVSRTGDHACQKGLASAVLADDGTVSQAV